MRSPPTDTVEAPLSAGFHSSRSGRHPDGVSPVGGLRMSQEFRHRPVMVDEILDTLAGVPKGVFVDATLGAGGHAHALLGAHAGLRLVGLDRDTDALAAAAEVLAEYTAQGRAVLRHARFDRLGEVVAEVGWGPITAVLFDLGVSSPQLDRAERGFSYREVGPLDMRMDRSSSLTAADVVNTYSEAALARLFVANGEARFARRIARTIIAARPVSDTIQLADIVKAAIPAPARRRGGHPAKRVFQAIRIEVNDELTALQAGLGAALRVLAPGGRCAVLTYHSGEDRIVKASFRSAATGGCTCPPGLPCVCGAVAEVVLVTRGGRTPSPAEVADNPRAESARLRAVERLGGTEGSASGGAR